MPAKILVNCQQVSELTKFGSGAWVGLYRDTKGGHSLTPSIDNKSYYAFEWVSNGKDVTSSTEDKSLTTVEKQLTFEVPKAGQWLLRLFHDRSYVDVATCSIDIAGEDRLELSVSGAQMKVECALNTVDPARDYVWVGIYKIEEKDQRQYRRYKYIVPTSSSNTNSTLTFKTPIHSGTYEARLFSNKSYEVVAKSASVTINGI